MTVSQITDKVNSLGRAWEHFKQVNDMRLAEIEKKGHADPLYQEQLGKISDALDNYKSRLDSMETAWNRPSTDAFELTYKSGDPFVSEYKKAFDGYLRKGAVGGVESFEKKALSVGSDPDGGYLVTPSMSSTIIRIVNETSPMRKVAAIETISTDALEILEDKDDAAAGWTTEAGSVADTTTPKLGKKNIPVHELYAQPKATQKLVDDSAIDIEQWLAAKVADIFSRKENSAFINGIGVGQPRGILTYAAGTTWGKIEQITSGSSGAVTADGLIKLYYGLKEQYAVKSTFFMNRSIVQSVRLLKDTTNQYIWQPGLSAGAPDTLLGVSVIQAADMPTASANSLSVALADFGRAYQIVDRIGIRVLRDPFTDKPFVKFYTTKRVGGDVTNFEAIKILKLA